MRFKKLNGARMSITHDQVVEALEKALHIEDLEKYQAKRFHNSYKAQLIYQLQEILHKKFSNFQDKEGKEGDVTIDDLEDLSTFTKKEIEKTLTMLEEVKNTTDSKTPAILRRIRSSIGDVFAYILWCLKNKEENLDYNTIRKNISQTKSEEMVAGKQTRIGHKITLFKKQLEDEKPIEPVPKQDSDGHKLV